MARLTVADGTGYEGLQDSDTNFIEIYALITALTAGTGVPVSSNDTTPGYLNGKLVAGTGTTLTEGSDGADETLTLALEDNLLPLFL